MKLVIVESPAKAKTIHKYLGRDYEVLASYGHVRDLDPKDGSVDPTHDFQMRWTVDDRGEKQMAAIAKALRQADALYLATDPDREGEAISWHVCEILRERKKLTIPVYRVVFNEVTKTAVNHALENPRDLDAHLVQAYLARRALDYLVGFTLSPVLWRKLPGSRSAGRVQSVALRLITDREAEIERFIAQEYWTIEAEATQNKGSAFLSKLTHWRGKKLDKLDIANQAQADAAVTDLQAGTFSIGEIERKQVRRNPAAPFTTSTLQQEASRKLGFSTTRTMRLAQQLYEGIDLGGETTGLITYMRTDGVQMAAEAIAAVRAQIQDSFGKDYLPDAPRVYKTKAKNAQEAHEAIRPTDVSRTPDRVRACLDESQFRLYELIWKRTMASQMAHALIDQVGVDIVSADRQHTLRATGSTIAFDGYLRLYQEGRDDADEDDAMRLLPNLVVGQPVDLATITPSQHFTQPPPRYSEAALVKRLEELGIGRPSTYASIIQVLQDRDYVTLERRQFIPQDRGRIVTSFLMNFFKDYVAYDFTAQLEEQLDDISSGKLGWQKVLGDFWAKFKMAVDATQPLRITEVIDQLEKDLAFFLFQSEDPAARKCPTCATGTLGLKLGKHGAFVGCSNYPECRHTRQIGKEAVDVDTPVDTSGLPRELGADPKTGEMILVKKGPYGLYLEWQQKDVKKPKRIGLPKGKDPMTITLDEAVAVGALPRQLGVDPATKEMVSANVGRFGPYVRLGSKFVSIPKGEDVLTITFERAAELIAAAPEKKGRTFIPRAKKAATTSKAKAASKPKAKTTAAKKKKTATKK